MATTNFNVSPYYDDFAESKKFHRVLFRPSFSIQGRELTQLQTILQNQIERFGEHIFKDGAMVIPGQVTLNTEYEYVKLASHSTSNVSSLNGLTVTGGTSGVVAEVTNTTEATSTAAATIYVTYTKTGTNNTAKTFTEGETISFTGGTAVVGTSGTSLPTASNATGRASAVKVEEGVAFVNTSGVFYFDGNKVNNISDSLIDSVGFGSSSLIGYDPVNKIILAWKDGNDDEVFGYCLKTSSWVTELDGIGHVPDTNTASYNGKAYFFETGNALKQLDFTRSDTDAIEIKTGRISCGNFAMEKAFRKLYDMAD